MLGVLLMSAPALSGSAVPLALFRTVYDLKLDRASSTAAGSINGRLVTEFTGSACAGYVTRSRFVTDASNSEGASQTSDVRMETLEAPDGTFTFDAQTFTDGRRSEQATGVAVRRDGRIAVELTVPKAARYELSGATRFPAEQVREVINAAVEGKRFLSFDLFDGAGDGETWYKTATVIGAPSAAADDLGVETAVADAGIATMRHWPVTISYFDPAEGMTPRFTMAFIVYQNGITRDMRIDYGQFALVGKLTALELLPEEECVRRP